MEALSKNANLDTEIIKLRRECCTVRNQYLICKKTNKRLRSMVGSLSKKKKIK